MSFRFFSFSDGMAGPANFQVAADKGVDLQLSGHTHGGQLVPMPFLIGLAWEHSAGLYRHGDAHLT